MERVPGRGAGEMLSFSSRLLFLKKYENDYHLHSFPRARIFGGVEGGFGSAGLSKKPLLHDYLYLQSSQ